MTIAQLIVRLDELVQTGTSPDSVVLAWDPDQEAWAPITGMTFGDGVVNLYTDED